MRLIGLKSDSLQAINARIKASTSTAGGAEAVSVERLKALNPHVDFAKLQPGAVLFLPEAAETPDPPGSSALDGGTFEAFAADLDTGFKASATRARAGFERLNTDRTEVAAILKTAAVKRLVESDPALKVQVDEANAQFAKDQKEAQEAGKQLEAMQKGAATEIAALAKLFG
jgi:hypothetical protein